MSGCEYKPPLSRALGLILERFPHPGPVVEIPLAAARGRVAARAVQASRPFPEADLSMMDGFAVGGGRGPGAGVPVRTGEAVPPWAEGVVPVEEVDPPGGDPARWARNVVRRGAEYRAGEIVLRPGEVIGGAQQAQLALLGRGTVAVRGRPRIAAAVFPAEPIASAAPGWLGGFLGAYFDVDFRPRPIGDPRELASLAEGADLALVVSDGTPGRYGGIKDALLGGAAGFEPVFWKLGLHPCRHAGFGVIGAVPVLVLPDVFFKTVISAMALLPPLLAAWAAAQPVRVTATWAAPPELRHPLPCLVPLRFEGVCRGPGLGAAAAPLHSTFSARRVVDAEGFTILVDPPRGDEPFDAVVLGRLRPGP